MSGAHSTDVAATKSTAARESATDMPAAKPAAAEVAATAKPAAATVTAAATTSSEGVSPDRRQTEGDHRKHDTNFA
jgi:hypothetical protein